MRHCAGVDLGATNVRVLVAAAGDVVGRDRRRTPQGPTGDAVTDGVRAALRAACDDAGISPERLDAVGVAAAGLLDLAEGVLREPPNIPGVANVRLVDPIEALVDGQVRLLNDADAGVIGERHSGDRTPDNLIYLTMSTGIGAGICIDGTVVSGWDGNSGEVGHLQLDPRREMTCGCGGGGHWEAYCSGANIPRYARYIHESEGIPTDLDLEEASAADVFDRRGDPLADEVVRRVGEWNVQGVGSLIHAYAPLAIYVGGGVALNNPERVLGPVREAIPQRVVGNVPDIQLTTLGDDVVVRGALAAVSSQA